MPPIRIFSKKVRLLQFGYDFEKIFVHTQQVFITGSYIQRLAPIFELPDDEDNTKVWSPQKVSNIYCVLQVKLRKFVDQLLHDFFF